MQRRKMIHEDFVEIMQLVTEPLRMELRSEIYGPIIALHPFFGLYRMAYPFVVKRICYSAMQMMLIASGDIVFDAGEIPKRPKMYLGHKAFLAYRHRSTEHSWP